MDKLKHLKIKQNQISDISVLENLTELELLDLTGNKISDISALEGVTTLTYLYLSNNQIKDISALKELNMSSDLRVKEQTLYLDDNVSVGEDSYYKSIVDINGAKHDILMGKSTHLGIETYTKEVKDESGETNYSAKITVTKFTKEGEEVNDNNGLVVKNGQLQLEKRAKL